MVRVVYPAVVPAVVLLLLTAGCAQHVPETSQPSPKSEAPPPAPVAGAPEPTTTGKAAPPVTETPAPKPEAPKAEAPKTEAPKTEAPKTEAPKAEAPKPEAPKTAAPKTAAVKPEAPKPPTSSAKPSAPKPTAPSAAPAPTKPVTEPTLDLDALKTELKDTKSIGVFTKLTLKNQVDDLLDKFRQHHAGKAKPTITELRQSYDLLMMKVLSLLQDKDQKLASEIVSSRETIWGLLADPKKFAALQT